MQNDLNKVFNSNEAAASQSRLGEVRNYDLLLPLSVVSCLDPRGLHLRNRPCTDYGPLGLVRYFLLRNKSKQRHLLVIRLLEIMHLHVVLFNWRFCSQGCRSFQGYLYESAEHMAGVFPRVVVDFGGQLDDLAGDVASHAALSVQHDCPSLYQEVGELLCGLR